MKIIERLKDLEREYAYDKTVRKNGTVLLGPGKVPRCRHMLFRGLEDEYIEEYLVSEYKNPFPEQYKEFLRIYNGAILFWGRLKTSTGISLACSMITVLGLPRTQPFGRPDDMEEPFDVRIEDLGRHKSLTKYLKFGTYWRKDSDKRNFDLLINTENGRVISCVRRDCVVCEEWNSIDECLCSLFDRCVDLPTEYEI